MQIMLSTMLLVSDAENRLVENRQHFHLDGIGSVTFCAKKVLAARSKWLYNNQDSYCTNHRRKQDIDRCLARKELYFYWEIQRMSSAACTKLSYRGNMHDLTACSMELVVRGQMGDLRELSRETVLPFLLFHHIPDMAAGRNSLQSISSGR
jgi:hypothetical protein